jgi:hypothetical protein
VESRAGEQKRPFDGAQDRFRIAIVGSAKSARGPAGKSPRPQVSGVNGAEASRRGFFNRFLGAGRNDRGRRRDGDG